MGVARKGNLLGRELIFFPAAPTGRGLPEDLPSSTSAPPRRLPGAPMRLAARLRGRHGRHNSRSSFGIQVRGKTAFLLRERAAKQLEERLIPHLARSLLPICRLGPSPAVGGLPIRKPGLPRSSANRTEEQFVGPGMKALHAPELILFFSIMRKPAFRRFSRIRRAGTPIFTHLVADQVSVCTAEHAVGAGSFLNLPVPRFSLDGQKFSIMVHTQFRKRLADWFVLASRISSGTP